MLIWIVWLVGSSVYVPRSGISLLVHLLSPCLTVPLGVLSSYVLLLFCQTLGSVFNCCVGEPWPCDEISRFDGFYLCCFN